MRRKIGGDGIKKCPKINEKPRENLKKMAANEVFCPKNALTHMNGV
jgi:hypothetical protein